MALLDVGHISSGYGETSILHDVSIRVEPGEAVTLIGPNGAGKSTLLRTIFGLLTPTKGRMLFDDTDITGMRTPLLVRRGLSYVPQVDNVFPSLTVQENLEMGAFVRHDGFAQRLEEMYTFFPTLRLKRKRRVGSLSGGERQMVAMGRALMLDPRLLLLDEPSAGLAPRLVGMVFEKLAEINQTGVALLIVEQNAREALRLSHRGYVMASGQVRLEGQSSQLLQNEAVGRLYLGGRR
ncbi:MAG TPA: ABC transporter ATP-binding protein [Candidatus Tectomicrobia bacterium]